MSRLSPIAVLILTVFIDLLGFGIVIPILPVFASDLGASATLTGLIAASFSVMNFLCSPAWGALSDRIGRRPVMLVSIAITAAGYLLLGFSTTLWLLLAARVLGGIGSANIAVAQAYITDISKPEDRTRNLGLIGAAFGIGFVVGPPLGGYLKSHYGIFAVGGFAAALGLLNLILAYIYLPEPKRHPGGFDTQAVPYDQTLEDPALDAPLAQRAMRADLNPFAVLGELLRKPVINHLAWVNFIFVAGFAMMQITSSLLWHDQYGLDEKHIGYTFAFLGIATAVVQGGLVRPLTNRFGERRLLLLGCVAMFGALVLMPLVPPEHFIPLELVSLAGIALANGALSPSVSSLIAEYSPPPEVGKNLGASQSFASLARVVGPSAGGALYQWDHRMPFFAGALVMVVCLVVVVALLRRMTPHGVPE
jgi:DHA1 family tetracycline resistance protein-like MFS transporter